MLLKENPRTKFFQQSEQEYVGTGAYVSQHLHIVFISRLFIGVFVNNWLEIKQNSAKYVNEIQLMKYFYIAKRDVSKLNVILGCTFSSDQMLWWLF